MYTAHICVSLYIIYIYIHTVSVYISIFITYITYTIHISYTLLIYREKSFFNIRINIIVKKAINNMTNTNEFMIDNQCISKVVGKKVESE